MAGPRRPDPQQGVFETMLALGGRPVELDAHLARLEASLAALYPGHGLADPRKEAEACAAGVELGATRVTIAPSATGLQAKVEQRQGAGPFLPLSGRKGPEQAVALHSLCIPDGLGAHKWADRSLLDEAQARLPAGSLPLIVDRDDAVLEASRANVFAVRDGALFTPPLDGRLLPGITRMRVLEIADSIGVEARETALRRGDLLAADEVFLTGSIRGVERARSLDGAVLGADGEVTADLGAELWRTWAGAQVG